MYNIGVNIQWQTVTWNLHGQSNYEFPKNLVHGVIYTCAEDGLQWKQNPYYTEITIMVSMTET